MNSLPVEIKISEDGSTTLYRTDMHEHYHSIHGAIQESEHVFIRSGLFCHTGNALTVLEVGFGTGLNAFLTLMHQADRQVVYHTVEKYPLAPEIIQKINYPGYFPTNVSKELFLRLHEVPWGESVAITELFELKKLCIDLLDFQAHDFYDLVYFDAFDPAKQPELWSDAVFKMLFEAMKPGSVLTTYSAKGAVRRSMMAAGFMVERIPGPPGKRQMLRAFKNID